MLELRRTRNGQIARIFSRDGVLPYPLLGAVYSVARDGWIPMKWTINGNVYDEKEESDYDLQEP